MATILPSHPRLADAKLYSDLMEEIKIRITAINLGTSGQLWMLPGQIIREFCFLQIRLICELVALGCLTAHGDLEKVTKLKKMWEADRIMEELEKLHPDFFPIPVRQEMNTPAKGRHNIEAIKGRLDKNGLIDLYHECGSYLHKGSLRNLLNGNSPRLVNFPDITSRAQKIEDLISVHAVFMSGGETVFICVLRSIDDNLKSQTSIAEKRDVPGFGLQP